MNNTGLSVYELAYVKSPIFLVNGIASSVPGKILPLIAITESSNLVSGVLSGNITIDTADFYANFFPMPGATLHNNQIAKYPFANQTVAANAIVAQPINISMRMNCTPRLPGAMVSRIMTATALKNALDNHNFLGGTYSVLTPSFLYQNCIMLRMSDITSGESKHQQTDWQIDFEQPLLNINQAEYINNSLMDKIARRLPTAGLWSGVPGA